MAKGTVISINLPQTVRKISRKVNDNPMTYWQRSASSANEETMTCTCLSGPQLVKQQNVRKV